jgi:hypothetical protein
MEEAAAEFGEGKLNRTQFTAIYKHYSDKRTIIEKLVQRNPESEAWRQVLQAGHTSFLRNQYAARPIFYAVFKHQNPQPLFVEGKVQPEQVKHINRLLRAMWSAQDRPTSGVAKKSLGDNQWLVLALGVNGITLVFFMLQPSDGQIDLVRDLHADFERANRMLLERGVTSPQRLVFPQRALIPQNKP